MLLAGGGGRGERAGLYLGKGRFSAARGPAIGDRQRLKLPGLALFRKRQNAVFAAFWRSGYYLRNSNEDIVVD